MDKHDKSDTGIEFRKFKQSSIKDENADIEEN